MDKEPEQRDDPLIVRMSRDALRYRWIREHPWETEDRLCDDPAEFDRRIDANMAEYQDGAGRQGIGSHDRSEVPAPHLSSAAPGTEGKGHGA